MPLATAHCVGMELMARTVGEILRPTKGEDSYPRIANRANAWLQQQADSGRVLEIRRMSAEQVRRIFEDYTERPKAIYLEALAAVQGVDLADVYEAAGYHTPVRPPGEILDIQVALRANRRLSEDSIRRIVEFVEQVEREDREDHQEGEQSRE